MAEPTDDQAQLGGESTAIAPGNSLEQQEAEDLIIGLLGNTLGVPLVKKPFDLPAGGWLEIDGYCDSPRILCEAWAHKFHEITQAEVVSMIVGVRAFGERHLL
jgi:hypothetical protein